MVRQLKFHGSLKFGRLIGELLAHAVKGTEKPDLLVPVPLHRQRLIERGFNHASLIANTTGKRLAIPVSEDLVIKRDRRPPQSGLNAKARRVNMRNAFHIQRPIDTRHIVVVDDVITTGATSEALAAALLDAGCQLVSVWAFARTAQGSAK